MNLADHVGDSAVDVIANRAILARCLAQSGEAVAVMHAVHGASVALATHAGAYLDVDALVTQTPGLVLMAQGADCVPVALVGSDGRTVAVAHCGWRGLVADVVGNTVEALRAYGTDVRLAVLGPSVCGRCYPVPPERAAEVRARVSAVVSNAALVPTPDRQPGIDVRAGLVARLTELKVRADAIVKVGGCTVEDRALFSYRRDGVTGRQAVAVCTMAT